MKKFVSGVGEVEMTPEEVTAFLAQQAADSQPSIPLVVTAAQAKVALYNANLLDAVENAVAASTYKPIQIYWASASFFERTHPYISGIASEVGLTDDQIDKLFVAASVL